MNTENMTPLMRQYASFKKEFPDALVLFQVGDFYELFFEDAQKAATFLGITLTKRGLHSGTPIPLCGVPVHSIDHYLVKLVRGGFRVVICNQKGTPQTGKMVEREVSQVLTPGTLTDIKLLQEKSSSYLAAFFPTPKQYGLLFFELLTGQLFLTLLSKDQEKICQAELSRFLPDEIIIPDTKAGSTSETMLKKWGYITSKHLSVNHETIGDSESDFAIWISSFANAQGQVGIIKQSLLAQEVLYLLYSYLKKNQERALAHCKSLSLYNPDDFLMLDAATQRNLELIKNVRDGGPEHTVFSVLDCACTPMGSRLIKRWLVRPLIKQETIEQRLNLIETLVNKPLLRQELQKLLGSVGDLERCVGRIALARAQLYDY
ncbi:MAG TPA: hypothetical protein VHA52_03235, partial [Candidatus Babeliaceae bacterium]|nr:hypothetical protein [Candidatus Babeliaceae bacterium]